MPEQPDLTPFATLTELLTLVARLREQELSASASALEVVGLEALGHRTIRELSQGQRRRAVLAAAMIGAPHVLLLDEPLEALDSQMRDSVLSWIDAAVLRGATLLVSTHDVGPFQRIATGALQLNAGRIVP